MNELLKRKILVGLLLMITFLALTFSVAESIEPEEMTVDSSIFQNIQWRSIGPAIMGGRMVDIEAVAGNPHIIYLGTASSGIWKSVNGGITFEPIFDDQPVHAIGDIAIAPSNSDILWVGTGEGNARDSVSCGNGVYRSVDAGKNWEHLGLDDTRFISAVVVHPTNPAIAYGAVIGHIWGPHKERGVYMTDDAGKSWKQVLYVDEETGASALDIDPSNPNILYAGMWTFQRHSWTHRSGSDKGGIFKSIDGGRTWKKMTNGLPPLIGRIGVKVAPGNPNVVYAIMECKEGTLYRSDDKGESWHWVNDDWELVMRGFYYAEIHIDPNDENNIFTLANRFSGSDDGGKTFRRINPQVHGDYHGMWIDPQDSNYMIIGTDGGIGISYDGGKTWDRINTMPHGQFYRISTSLEAPFYKVAGGLQDNGSWYGPVRSRSAIGIINDDWFTFCGGDGFYTIIHHEKPYLMIGEGQCGRMRRVDIRTGNNQSINPSPFPSQAHPARELPYRFAWNTPVVPSPHDPSTIYLGGNVLFRSTNFGTDWEIISPDLTTDNPEKQKPAGGPVAIEGTGAEYHCTIRTISESPVQKDVIWVGSDDGLVHITQDGGTTWTNVTKNIHGMPPEGYITQIEASRTDVGVAYMTYDRHMLDDVQPYVFKTSDFGKSWVNITSNLPPNAWAHVIREDPKNPKVLYVGTEFGIFASFSGGGAWVPLSMKNLPTVSIRDLLVHPLENDLILGTHGRSLYVLDDVTFLQQLSDEVMNSDIYLFDLRKAWRYHLASNKTTTGGQKAFVGENPDYGAFINYYLKELPGDGTSVQIQILDLEGNLVNEMTGTKNVGVNRIIWPLDYKSPTPRTTTQTYERGRVSTGPQALPGEYIVKLILGDREISKRLQIDLDPILEVEESELRKQWQSAMELRDMLSSLNLALRALDDIESKAKSLQQKIKKDRGIPESVAEVVDNISTKSVYIRKNMSREGRNYNWTPGYIYGKVSSLFSMIESTNAAPTPHQLDFLNEIKDEFHETIERVNHFISEDIHKLNQALKKQELPEISVEKIKEISNDF